MALDTGNYISDLSRLNPTSSDLVSEGDDVLRFVKKILQKTFPMGTDSTSNTGVGPDQAVQVIIAKATAPTIAGTVAESHGLVWLDTTTDLLKIRNKANDAWITLAVNPETSNSVDINAGTIDGAVIGGAVAAAVTTTDLTATTADINAGTIDGTIIGGASAAAITTTDLTATTADINAGTVDAVLGGTTPAAITGTTIKANTSIELATGATVTGIDNGGVGTGSATLLATQGAVKTYVDAQVTAQDLDITTDSGTIDIDLDSDTLTVAGGSGLNSSATGTTVTIAGDDATTSAKGVASFSSDNFGVSSGAVTIKDAGVALAEIQAIAGNSILGRDASDSGVLTEVAIADTELLIGDGTGFAPNTLSKDATLLSTGALTVTGIQGQSVTSTAATNDQYLKYAGSPDNEWQMVTIVGTDKLTTVGDLLVYNTVASETRLPVGDDGTVLFADSTATNGVAWGDLVDNSAAMALALGG